MNLTSVPWCSLEGRAFQERMTWIAELNRKWLRGEKLEGRTLELTYQPEAENALQELLAREQECCVTLQFDLARTGSELKLTVTLPASTGGDIQAQFAPFRSAKIGADLSCCGTCDTPSTPAKTDRAAGAAAATAATAALACGVCCVLPIALPAVATGATGSIVAWFANAHGWMTSVAVALVVLSWVWVAGKSFRSKAKPAISTVWLMSFATLALVAAVLWPKFESAVIAAVRP